MQRFSSFQTKPDDETETSYSGLRESKGWAAIVPGGAYLFLDHRHDKHWFREQSLLRSIYGAYALVGA